MEKFEWKIVLPFQVPTCDYNLDVSGHLLPFSANCELITLTGLWPTPWHTPGPATQGPDILAMGFHNGGPVSYQALAFCPQVESYLRQAAVVAEGTIAHPACSPWKL